jgi:phytanoyl-CoA dioxygenase PhyH
MVFSIGPIGRLLSQDKVVDSKVLNIMGAQVFRTLLARALYTIRRVAVTAAVAHQVADLKREGIVILRHFLPADHFERVRAECEWLDRQRQHVATRKDGSTTLDEIALGKFSESVLPSIYQFYDDPRLRGIMAAAEQRPLGPLARYGEREYLTQGASGDDADPQTELHSDIFFNTHKAWFYLEDVRIEDGPLVYVKGSHRLTRARLSFVYRDSWKRGPASDQSRRISAEEQRRLEVQETVVTCPGNTLVVVNTCGYHRRLQGQPGRTRCALHLSLRANPFAPHGLRSMVARYPPAYRLLRHAKVWQGRR